MQLAQLIAEVKSYTEAINVGEEGEHLYSNYQEIVAMSLRLQQIHNDIAEREILGQASPELKKFRTMIVDPTIEQLKHVAQFESRKITARQIEHELEKR
jgi:hypothetical protein